MGCGDDDRWESVSRASTVSSVGLHDAKKKEGSCDGLQEVDQRYISLLVGLLITESDSSG